MRDGRYSSHIPSRMMTLPRSSGSPRQARTVLGTTRTYRKEPSSTRGSHPNLSANADGNRPPLGGRGCQHFLWPGDVTAQAEHFVGKAPKRTGDLLAVDRETTGDGTHASNAEKDRFIRKVAELRPHHRAVLYANRHFWLDIDTTSYAGDGLWIAGYVTAGKPRVKAAWRFHRYTSNPLDKNVGNFTDRAAPHAWATSA